VGERRICLLRRTIGAKAYGAIDNWLQAIWKLVRAWADEAVTTTTGWYSTCALTIRARVAIAVGDPKHAERALATCSRAAP
jgi:hypothetical protein